MEPLEFNMTDNSFSDCQRDSEKSRTLLSCKFGIVLFSDNGKRFIKRRLFASNGKPKIFPVVRIVDCGFQAVLPEFQRLKMKKRRF